MVAVHDPEVIWHENCCSIEGSDVLGDHDSALRDGGLQHALVIDPAEAWSVSR